METKVVSYEKNDELVHRVTVSEETALIRMRRNTLQINQVNIDEPDHDLRLLRIVLYPDCVSATCDWGTFVQAPTIEEFIELPGKFVDDWATAAWTLNPSWSNNIVKVSEEEEEAENEKKLLSSTNDSPDS